MDDKIKELSLNELSMVAGGEYDPDEQYLSAMVVRAGNLYNLSNLRQAVGQIAPGRQVGVHPTFRYIISNVAYIIVRVDGVDYCTEEENVAK